MTSIVKRLFEAQNDNGVNVLELGYFDNFDAIKKEALDIIENKQATTILAADDINYYREDDYIINAKDHKKLYDQLKGGYRSFQLLRPEPGWTDIYHGLSPDADHSKWKFWAANEYPNIENSFKQFPSCFNCCIGGFLPHSMFTVHREPIIKMYQNKWLMICRLHVPLTTNDKCSNYVGDGYYHFEEGKMYFFNLASKHDGKNESNVPRYHLVYDLVLTEKVIGLLESGKPLNPKVRINLEVNPNRDVKSNFEDIYVYKENPFKGF